MKKINYSDLQRFTQLVFEKNGASEVDAKQATETLLSADLRGISSHGIARLGGYLRLLKKGRMKFDPKIAIIDKTPSTAVVDGDEGLGLLIGNVAMQTAIEKAKKVGTAWVAARNSTHFGIAGYYAIQALKEDMIGIAMTNASPLVAPIFGRERMLGTNPIAFAIPTKKEIPFVADFATSAVPNGKLEIAQREEKEVPQGWVQDKQGLPSTNSRELEKGGTLLPLGGTAEMGGHKGYCLASVVDILSGVLSGANFGPWIPPFVSFMDPPKKTIGKGIGHFFGAMRIDAFQPKQVFLKQMDAWVQRFQQTNAFHTDRPVLTPGEVEYFKEIENKKYGIPIHEKVIKELTQIGKDCEISSELFTS